MTGTLRLPGQMVGERITIRVISPQGCALEGAEDLANGKKCELYISWRGSEIGVEGEVVSRDSEGRIGLKFLSVDKDIQKRLDALCETLRVLPLSTPAAGEMAAVGPLAESLVPRPPARAARAPSTAMPPPPPARVRERRRVPRYVSELRARFSDLATGESVKATLVTLSVLGCCLEGSQLLAAGQKCEVSTEWEGQPLQLQGEVVWNKHGQAGVKFESLDEGTEKLLRQICANLRLQPMAPLPPEPE
jgi:hypothetical protein